MGDSELLMICVDPHGAANDPNYQYIDPKPTFMALKTYRFYNPIHRWVDDDKPMEPFWSVMDEAAESNDYTSLEVHILFIKKYFIPAK